MSQEVVGPTAAVDEFGDHAQFRGDVHGLEGARSLRPLGRFDDLHHVRRQNKGGPVAEGINEKSWIIVGMNVPP